MKILISIEHPAWAHQFRYLIAELERRGHTVKVVAINKDRDLELLDLFGIKYEVISDSSGVGFIEKALILLKTTGRIWSISRAFRPDLFVGRASPMMSINAFLARKKHIVFEDTEHSNLSLFIARLFSDVILTGESFQKRLGKKQVSIKAIKELFYLHPRYFKPNPATLKEIGLKPGDKFFIVRFVAWDAHHDWGHHGFSQEEKKRLIDTLSKYGRVLVTSEKPLTEDFESYRIAAGIDKIHDLLYYATLYIGEGSTMAAESAVLGTPSIYVASFANDLGYMRELEEDYGLAFRYKEAEPAIQKAEELVQNSDVKQIWSKRREQFLSNKLDVTEFMVNFIDSYLSDEKRNIMAGVD